MYWISFGDDYCKCLIIQILTQLLHWQLSCKTGGWYWYGSGFGDSKMKKLLLIMFCLTLVLPIVCSADTIVSRAGLTYTCVGTCAPGGLTVLTTPNSAWATIPGASWISYASNTSGQGAYTPTANGTVMTVTDMFNATAGTTVTIHVLADDTTGVLITPGTFSFPAVTGPPGTFHTCAPTVIGCLTSTEGNFSFIAPSTG